MGARQAYRLGIKFGLPQCLHDDDVDPPHEILGSDRIWPLVQFAHHTILCVNFLFEAVSSTGRVEASRRQVSSVEGTQNSEPYMILTIFLDSADLCLRLKCAQVSRADA